MRTLSALLVLLAACGPIEASPPAGDPQLVVAEARPSEPELEPEPASVESFPGSRAGGELVGTLAQPFSDDLTWLSQPVASLEALRGQVVLVRFWTNTCPFCEASAPGLEQLHERYASEGLTVIGVYHPKPRGQEIAREALVERVAQLGMGFPIAIDSDWSMLERWWLRSGSEGRAATSVSFLIDAAGRIRWIHPGPEFHPDGPEDHEQCREDFEDARRAIEQLLAEREA